MSIPTFLSTSYSQIFYQKLTAVTDWNTFLTAIATALGTAPMAWTNDGGTPKTFKTPVDAAGRWFDVKFTRISATKLEIRVRDSAGATIITRRIQVEAGGIDVEIFAGDKHLFIQANRATPEPFIAFMIDASPDADSAIASNYAAANAYRAADDTADGLFADCTQLFMYDPGAAAMQVLRRGIINTNSGVGFYGEYQTVTGRYLFKDFAVYREEVAGTTYRAAGRVPQMLLGPDLAVGTIKSVPIDDSTTAQFQRIGSPAYAGSKAGLWVRKGA